MKILLLLIPFLLFGDIVKDFKNKKYSSICCYQNIRKYEKQENLESLVGIACVKSDKLVLLPYIIKRLRWTKEGRINAIYFLTIYTQKRLLYSFLFDGFDIGGFSFPKTDYFLSDIFERIKTKQYEYKYGKYFIKEGKKEYVIFKNDDKMIVETYENGKLIKRRWFR